VRLHWDVLAEINGVSKNLVSSRNTRGEIGTVMIADSGYDGSFTLALWMDEVTVMMAARTRPGSDGLGERDARRRYGEA